MKPALLPILALMLGVMGMVNAAEEAKEAPKSALEPIAADISHEDLVKAIKDKKVVLLDCNGTESYNQAHIPGALDFDAVQADLAKKLPEDKSTLIVSYCGGPM